MLIATKLQDTVLFADSYDITSKEEVGENSYGSVIPVSMPNRYLLFTAPCVFRNRNGIVFCYCTVTLLVCLTTTGLQEIKWDVMPLDKKNERKMKLGKK